jgi:hypothetical protein
VVIDEGLPDPHGIATAPERLGDERPVRLAGTRTRCPARPRHGRAGGGNLPAAGRGESVDSGSPLIAGFDFASLGRPRPRTGIPAALR